MKYSKNLSILILGLMAQQVTAQQSCNDYLDKTTSDTMYEFQAGGQLVFDKSTGLTWKRCLEGQLFDDNQTTDIFKDDQCTGTATNYLRIDALTHTNNSSDYRLPNIKELASLTELQCKMPSINLYAFPNQPETWVWSATPIIVENNQTALSINFTNGTDGINGAEDSLIRFIKIN